VPISYRGRTYREGKKITWKDGAKAIFVMLYFKLVDDPVRREVRARHPALPLQHASVQPMDGRHDSPVGWGSGPGDWPPDWAASRRRSFLASATWRAISICFTSATWPITSRTTSGHRGEDRPDQSGGLRAVPRPVRYGRVSQRVGAYRTTMRGPCGTSMAHYDLAGALFSSCRAAQGCTAASTRASSTAGDT